MSNGRLLGNWYTLSRLLLSFILLGSMLTMSSALKAQPMCNFSLALDMTCNDNGTPCDQRDDYYTIFISVSEPQPLGGAMFVVENGPNTWGPFPYAPLPLYLGDFPAGQDHCFDVFEATRRTCTEQICTGVLQPCSDTTIFIGIQRFVCNDNRTANDESDDFYTVYFYGTPPAPGWGGTFEVQAGGTTQGGLAYSTIHSLVLPADGSFQQINIIDELDVVCNNFNSVGPLNPCSTPCEMTAQVIDYVCNDNGTPDPSDDFYVVTVTATAVTPSMANIYILDGGLLPPVPLRYGDVRQILIPARGQYETLVFNDSYYIDCGQEIEIGPLDPCSITCETNIDSLSWICDNKGTPDPSDDEYLVTMIVSDTAAGSGYNVQIGGTRYGPFEYEEIEYITLPADGSMPRLNFRDLDFPVCNTFEFIGPLDPCSYPCDLVINSVLPECDDNGTVNTADDFYRITVNIDYLQGTMTDSFTLEMGGNNFGPYAYNEDNIINWPADGSSYELIIQDLVLGIYCEIRDTIGPLDPCSSPCDLDIQVTNVRCNNNRTGLDPNDDTFTFDLTVNGTNVSNRWRVDDPNMTSANYGNTANLGPFLISGGNLTLTITDVVDPFCRQTFQVQAPPTCSDSCFIQILDFTVGPCNDNNTGQDKTDDFFFLDLLVDGDNVSAGNNYYVFLGGMQFGPYVYGVREAVGPLPANGTFLNLTIRDADTGYCEDYLQVSQQPCSDCDDVADAGANKLITCSDNTVTLEGSGTAPGNYSWVGPGGRTFSGPNPQVGEPGTYVLTVTFAKGCTSIDSVVVSRDTDLPVADPGANADLTCVVDSILIGGVNTSTGPNLVYEWRDQNNTLISDQLTFSVGLPGVYCLKVIDTVLNCESAVNCVTIGENRVEPSGDIFVNPNDAFDCRVDSILLVLENDEDAKYYWEKNTVISNLDSLWVTDTGMVYVVITDTINGCTKTLSINITSLIDYPVISLMKPDTITCLNEDVTIDGRNSQSGPSIVYQWFDENSRPISGANGRTLTVSEPGIYIFEALDTTTGCQNLDTISVGENRFYHVADAGEDEIIKCDSTTVVLNASGSTVRNDISYTWRGLGIGGVVSGQGTLFPTVDGGGEFELKVRDDITGCESFDTVYVERVYPPSIDFLSVKNETCGGDELGKINIAGISGIRPLTYQLNGRPVQDTKFDSLAPGLFFFRVTDSLGCYADTLLEVKEGNFLMEYEITGDTFIFRGDSTVLNVEIDLPDNQVDQVYWSENGSVFCFRCYSVTVKPEETTTYTFRLIDINGCEIEFDFVVKVQDRNDIYVPNAFTPNEDTENEVLHVFGKHLTNIDRMMIFNRWGELVFQGFNLPPGPVWDGKWNGEYHVPAVLTYVIDATFENGEQKQFTGDITLLR